MARIRFLLNVSLLLIIPCLTGCDKKPPAEIADPAHLLFLGYAKEDVDCGECHGPEGQGTMKAPHLYHVFEKYSEDEVRDIIDLGAGQGKDSMPPFEDKLDEQDLTLLIQFLKKIQSSSKPLPDSLRIN